MTVQFSADPYADRAREERKRDAQLLAAFRGLPHAATVAPDYRPLTVDQQEACGPWGPFPEREQIGWLSWCSSCGTDTTTRHWPMDREQTARAWRCPRSRRAGR